MAFYKEDIVDINLNTGNIFRSFLGHSIGYKDDDADRFGIRAFRDGVPVDLSGASCQAIFMNPNGTNIALTSYGTVSGNVAYVTLPPACYDYEGQFCLAIKLVGGGVTGTVRIVDGTVTRTGASGTVAPTSSVPTYQEILSTYDAMVAATSAANLAIAETFDATKAYPAGKYVINEGHLYRLTADHAANVTWANTSKVATNFGDDLTELKSALSEKNLQLSNISDIDGIAENVTLKWDKVKDIAINYSDGTELTSGICSRTNYIFIGGLQKITYKRIKSTSLAYYGIAFYDENYVYISGIQCEVSQAERGYVVETVDVPNGAYYVCCTILRDTSTYGYFEIGGKSVLGSEIVTIENEVDDLYVKNDGTGLLELGGIIAENGSKADSTTTLRTINYLPDGWKEIKPKPGYVIGLYAYDPDAETPYKGYWTGSAFQKTYPAIRTSVGYKNPNPEYKYYAELRNSSGTTMSLSDAVNIEFYCQTDSTLTQSGKSADAYQTGETIKKTNKKIADITQCDLISFSDPSKREYINTSGSTVDWSTPSVSYTTPYKWAVVECSEGDLFTINGHGGSSPRLWAFADSSKNIISNSASGATASGLYLTAPENSAYLIINDDSDKESYIGKYLIQRVENLEDAIGLSIVSLEDAETLQLQLDAIDTEYVTDKRPYHKGFLFHDINGNKYYGSGFDNLKQIGNFDINLNNKVVAISPTHGTVIATGGETIYVYDGETVSSVYKANLRQWLYNSGVDFIVDNNNVEHCIFAEYGGGPYDFHVWRGTYPYTSASDWESVLTVSYTDLNHFHMIRRDPWTDILYCCAGDDDALTHWWYSTDYGATWTKLLDGNSVVSTWGTMAARLINFVFTEDYIYWATDNHANHILCRIQRNGSTGIIDLNTFEKLADLKAGCATNSVCYSFAPHGLFMYERIDYLATQYYGDPVTMQFYDLDTNELMDCATLNLTEDTWGGNRGKCYVNYTNANQPYPAMGFAYDTPCIFDMGMSNNGDVLTVVYDIKAGTARSITKMK